MADPEIRHPDSPEAAAETLGGLDYMSVLWRQRRVLLAVVALFMVLALVIRLVLPPQYQGDIGMVPADTGDQVGNVVGTLASLGLMRGGGGNNRRYVALATLQSRDFLQRFITENNLMPVLFASDWDASARKWKSAEPSLEKGYERLYGAMTVVTSTADPVIRLRVRWEDSAVAASLANNLVRALNRKMQTEAMQEADRMIAALTQAYKETTIQELRANIANLIQGQLHQRIMAQSRPEYAVEVVDPAMASTRRVSPGLSILLPLGLLLGLLFGVPAAFLWHVREARNGPPRTSGNRKDGARWRLSFSR